MARYYKFINVTQNKESEIPLPFYFDMPYAKNLDENSQSELIEIFDQVAEINNWSNTDELIAVTITDEGICIDKYGNISEYIGE